MLKTLSRSDLLALIFLVGFCSLVYEIYSVRVLFMFFVKSTQAASIAISSFLAGIAFSSLIFSRFSNHNQRNLKLIFWLQIASAIYGYFVLSHYEAIPDMIDALKASELSETLILVLKAGIVWLFLFVPAFFMGGAFPLVNGLYMRHLENSSKDTGTVYFWDTLGAIFGALLAGFLFIPQLGLEITLLIPVALNLCCALMVAQGRYIQRIILAMLFILVLGESLRHNRVNLGIDLRTQKEKLESRFGELLFQKESPFGTVTVNNAVYPQLYVNYRPMCMGGSKDGTESIMGRITGQSIGKGATVANIGLGCGMTALSLIEHPHIVKLDVIEINPIVLEAVELHLTEKNGNVTSRDDVKVILEEGYNYLRNIQKTYDAIAVDIEEPTIVHSSAIYTKEFFEVVNQKLNDDGVFALWSFSATPEFSRVIYNTLKSTFPHVVIKHFGSTNNFFAAKSFNAVLENEKSPDYTRKLLSLEITEVNTIEEPNAEKYYDLNTVFKLPANYRDAFERDSDKTL